LKKFSTITTFFLLFQIISNAQTWSTQQQGNGLVTVLNNTAFIRGADGDGNGGNLKNGISFTASGNQTITFNYSYITYDNPGFDPFFYSINGIFIENITGSNSNSSFTVNLTNGQVFFMGIDSGDGFWGNSEVTITNLIPSSSSAPTFSNPGSITLCQNGSYFLDPSTTNGTFSSSDPTVATVNSSGYVTAVSASGNTDISLTTLDGTVTATVTVGTTSSVTITDPTAKPNYKFIINTPQGPVDSNSGVLNYVGYNGFNYASQTQPTNTGFYRASKQDGNEAGCPVQFYIIKCDGCVTVSESYSSVAIGSQIWTDKNLNVSKYKNGDDIPQVTDAAVWASLTTGAWCYYNNDPANETIYGKLYNWYAVNDPRGLAPQGWHMPTDLEWTNLAATPSYQTYFAGLLGGIRAASGGFTDLGIYGQWWSATEDSTNSALNRAYYGYDNNYDRWSDDKRIGFSVRLIKD
jgi:Fibrobacter succinogenes major domain (Fib_succ_major)